jgi:type IV secretory pathway VirB4 component
MSEKDKASTKQPQMLFVEPKPRPVWFSLDSDPDKPIAHTMIVGPTGSGKSALCNTLLIQMMKGGEVTLDHPDDQENPSCG